MNIFGYTDYRTFINGALLEENRSGARSRLARAANCSPSWMTRALSGLVQLTPDQAHGVAQYFHLGDQETDYLLLLVELERASTYEFKKRLQTKLAELSKANRSFTSAVKTDSTVSEKDAIKYYTSWIYAAAHVACIIGPSTLEELSRLVKVDPDSLSRVLNELMRMGLIVKKSGKWQATHRNAHLSADHPMAKISHLAWRSHTVHKLQENHEGLHYSAVHCLSMKDMEIIRKRLKDIVLECRKVIEDSPSEGLAVLCLDWYSL